MLVVPQKMYKNSFMELNIQAKLFWITDSWKPGLRDEVLNFHSETWLKLWGTMPTHDNVSEWWIIWCWELICCSSYHKVREQKRHIRKDHIKFLKTSWTAGCPWDTRPVSRQKCQFFYSKQQEIPGTPTGRPLFVSPGVPGTPGRCPEDFLKFMCLFLSWKVESRRKTLAVWNHRKQGTDNPCPFRGWQWQVEFACHLLHRAMALEPHSSGRPAWCYHHEGKGCILIALSPIRREPTVHLWRTLKDCAPITQSPSVWSWISQCLRVHVCSVYETKTKRHYTQSHYAPLKMIPQKYWACKGGVFKSVFSMGFGPK